MAERPRQMHLFGEPPVPKRARRGGVGAAEPDRDLVALASRLPRELRMGTSSWSFPGWRGIVWDREASASVLSRTGLAAYARHPLLRAVGVDRTFYAPVTAEVLAGYAEQVPEDFRFLVKAPAAVTSPYLLGPRGAPRERNPDWLDPSVARDAAVAPFVEGLGAKRGALVFQFPPLGREAGSAEAFVDRLHGFLAGLPREVPVAVELRDRTLLGERYGEALRDAGATHCISVHPRLPPVAAQARWVDPEGALVVRWMLGGGQRYDEARERYAPFDRLVDEDPSTREALAAQASFTLGGGRPVLVIVNNKAEGSAPLSVFRLAEEIARTGG